MAVPRLRSVTGTPPDRRLPPLVAGTAVLMAAALLAACAGGRGGAEAGAPGDGPARTPGGPSLEPSPGGSPRPAGGLPAGDLVRAARDAFAAAPSVHVTGTVVKGAQSYDLDLRLKGTAGGTARIVPSTSGPGTGSHPEVRVIRIGDVAWVDGNLGFWQAVTGDVARARTLVGSCVKVATDGGNFGEYVTFTQPATLVALLPDPKAPATLEPPVPVEGRQAIPVEVDRTTRLSVAAEGPAYPLQLSGLTSDETVSRFLNFSGYGAPVRLSAPSCATGEPGTGGGEPGSGGEPGGGGQPGGGGGEPGGSTGS
jgi:hypothetical protein